MAAWAARQAVPARRAAAPVQSLALGGSFTGGGGARYRGGGGWRTLTPDARLPGGGGALPRAGGRRRSPGDAGGGAGAGILCAMDTQRGRVEGAWHWSLWRGRCVGWRLDGGEIGRASGRGRGE